MLLLHGHPRTATWRRVAPLLAEDRAVACPDLRGYAESSKRRRRRTTRRTRSARWPATCVALMRMLAHDRFAVVGHDRGAYVAQRLAAEQSALVTHLVVMDAVPSASRSRSATHSSRTVGGTGSFWARQRSLPSGSSPQIPAPGTRSTPGGWARRRTKTSVERSTIPRSCTRCARTAAPVLESTGLTTTPIGQRDGGSGARP